MKPNRGILALLTTVLIWGSTFVITKAALRDLGALTLCVLRFAIAYALLVPLAWRQGYRPGLSARSEFLCFGLTGVALYYGLQNLGLLFTSSANAVLVLSIIPAVTALLAMWLLRERLGIPQVLGIVLALVGASLVGLATTDSQDAPHPLLGNALILGSVLAWATYTIQGKRLSVTYPPLVSTTASMGAGILMLLPLALGELALSGLPRMSQSGLLATLYLGLAATALPMFLWNYALSLVAASVASLYLNLVPVVGVLFALAVGERIVALQVVGGVIALAGVWLSSRDNRPPR